MNVDNARTLVSQLERLPDNQFKMTTWVDHDGSCGTVACIAGWCSLLNGGPTEAAGLEDENGSAHFDFAQEFLGLKPDEATRLFGGYGWAAHRLIRDLTLSDAIAELNRRIEAAEL